MRKSGTFAAQQPASSSHAQGWAQKISSRSHKDKQYRYFHFYFLLFLLHTPFCSTRLGDQRARSEVKSSFVQRLPQVITSALGRSHSSPCSDDHSSAMESPTHRQGTGMKQGWTAPFFKDLQAHKANNSFFAVLFLTLNSPHRQKYQGWLPLDLALLAVHFSPIWTEIPSFNNFPLVLLEEEDVPES